MVLGKGLKNTIFSRIVAVFLIAIIPLYLLGMSLYNWGLNAIQREIQNTLNSQVTFYLNDFESDIRRTQDLLYDTLNDEDLNQLAILPDSMDNYQMSKAILRVQNRLDALKNSSSLIDDVKAYIPALDRIVSANEALLPLNGTAYKTTTERVLNYDEANRQLVMRQSYPLKDTIEQLDPQFVIDISFSMSRIEQNLAQLNYYEDSGLVLYDRAQTYTIASGAESGPMAERLSGTEWKPAAGDANPGNVTMNDRRYITVSAGSEFLDVALVKYVSFRTIFANLTVYSWMFWLFSGISLAAILLIGAFTYRKIHRPMLKLINSFRKLEQGYFHVEIQHRANDEFKYLYLKFNSMTENIRLLIDQVYNQKILAQRSELRQLQAQINPHFLYNSFFILKTMARNEEFERIESFTDHLGEYFRFITRNDADEVPLTDEVEHARAYANIQLMRFYHRVELSFGDLPRRYAGTIVPRLIVQPLIENAFEHGMKRKKQGGLIAVRFEQTQPGRLTIVVEDNGDDAEPEKLARLLSMNEGQTETTALVNIKRRLEIKYESAPLLTADRSELGGLRISLHIPILDEVDHV
ncbi:sensor histidine kinase [Cohnella silvisoli]|uniref:Histidine kinase n=1 Tax=Cohnella silvisoli TaxID=2873699 RepID=A0ABV1KTE9_9BACL|nr:histidine kinase [Cohnella silvisoli]MCD9022543.1 histidine kinase [Cohnella silvisoli]